MKQQVNIFFISLFTLIISIIHLNCELIEKPGTIEYYSKNISGKWKLLGYYENDIFVEKLINTRYSFKASEKESEKILTDSGFITKIFSHDSLISIMKHPYIEILEMNFEKNGHGHYQYYNEYIIGSNFQYFASSQPIPQIILKNGKCFIHFLFMGGESEKEFVIKNDTLIHKIDENSEIRYVKFVK